MADETKIESLQSDRYGDPEQAATEQMVRQLVGRLDPHNDDQHQDYPSLLRRLQVAIDRELSKWTSASVQPPGRSGETAVANPQQEEPAKEG